MSVSQLDKIYNPTHIEDKWYQHWLDKNYFYSKPDSNKKPYTIVIPPPNVTGMLTMGHVLNNTIQDILIRKAITSLSRVILKSVSMYLKPI